jgi:hypothetical protein
MNQITFNLVDDKYDEARKYGDKPFTIPSTCRSRPLPYMAQCLRAYGTDIEDGTVNIFVGVAVLDEQLTELSTRLVKSFDEVSDQMYRLHNGDVVGVDAYVKIGVALAQLSNTMLTFYDQFIKENFTFRDARGATMWRGTSAQLHRMRLRMELMARKLQNHMQEDRVRATRDGTLSPGPSWIERHPNTPRVEYIEDGT